MRSTDQAGSFRKHSTKVDAGLLDHVALKAPLLHDGRVGSVAHQELDGIEQHRSKRRSLGDDGALIEILETVLLTNAGQFKLAVGLRNEVGQGGLRGEERVGSLRADGEN